MSDQSSSYSCEYCSKTFILKHNYDRHSSTCSFFYKTPKEISDEIDNEGPVPTMKEMYSLIQHMALRIQKLEKINANLKQRASREDNPLIILKNITPELGFSQWLKKYMLPDVKNHIQTVFDYTLFDGIVALFKDVFAESQRQSCRPIQYYSSKQNNIYIYDVSAKNRETWKVATNADLDKYIHMITNEFHNQFRIWFENNEDLMGKDEELFHHYYQKILSDDKLCKRKLKKHLCECLSNESDSHE